MIYSIYNSNLLISKVEYDQIRTFKKLNEAAARSLLENDAFIKPVFLNSLDPSKSKCSFCSSSIGMAFIDGFGEDISLLEKKQDDGSYPEWLSMLVRQNGAMALNIQYPCWVDMLESNMPLRWKINVAGLGDVGSTLVTGLRLLGNDTVDQVGIFDLDQNKVLRHLYECNQIYSPFGGRHFPDVVETMAESIFDCDMFVFCVTAGVPPIGEEKTDVRLAQFKANAKIIAHYAKMARDNGYKGIFAVVSDPVDQLCKAAYLSSNTDEDGKFDGKGILPDQIRGYGLGVMNARAVFYARQQNLAPHYETEGRAFGPHGEGLVIADSIQHYNHQLSMDLTDKAKKANLVVRELGYKPYIAPALSSAALSILDTIQGNWHYSSTFMGNAFIGAKNRLTPMGTELEQYVLPPLLKERLAVTYERLSDFNA